MNKIKLSPGSVAALLLAVATTVLPAVPSYATSPTYSREHPGDPAYTGKPVSLVSGAETMKRTDLVIGNLFPIRIERSYNSKTTYDSPMGYGWAHNYDKRLYTYLPGPSGAPSAIIRQGNGLKRRFQTTIWCGNICDYIILPPLGDSGKLDNGILDYAIFPPTNVYTQLDGTQEAYDTNGRLAKITDPRGNSLTFFYDPDKAALVGILPTNLDQTTPVVVARNYRLNRIEENDASGTPTGVWVTFQYDASTGRLTSITDSIGRSVSYSHDTTGNLTGVVTPALAATYSYTDANNKHLLTTADEGEGLYTNTYDIKGKVIKQTHGTGTIDIAYTAPYQKTTVTTTIKDSAGNVLNTSSRMTEFDSQGQVTKETDTFGNETRYTYDAYFNISHEERWENTGTVSAPSLVLKSAEDNQCSGLMENLLRTEGQGSTVEKSTNYTYVGGCSYWTEKTKPLTITAKSVVNPSQNKVTTNAYDTRNNLTGTIETGLLGDGTAYSYTTGYEYDANSRLTKIDGPRTDVQDITTFTYDTTGNLTAITLPVIGAYTLANHDGLGNPGTVTDPNGNTTTYTYDAVGRVTSIKAPGDTAATQYGYVAGGCPSCGGVASKIDHITLPEGNTLFYAYNATGNLSAITDSQGNSVNYSYDSEGNRLKEDVKDPSGALQKTISYQYDALNRLAKIVNPDSTFSQFTYDSLDNRTSARDPKGNTTNYAYDALSRMTSATQPGNITTGLAYNSNNNLTTVTDANNNATVYKYDDMGRVYQTISPDTGTTTYAYDPAGNLVGKTDASGTTIAYSYDALNRLTGITFPSDPAITYTYDTCPNGKGLLCAFADQSGTTSYEYTKKGQIAKETRTIDAVAYVTQYTYDMNGNTKTVTYPLGRVATYSYSNDRVTGVSSTSGGVTATFASNMTYKPFGGIAALIYGNGLNRTIGYDNQYRASSITTGTLQNLAYGYDANANITGITNTLDSTKNKSYTYDALNRLSGGTGLWGSLSWTYDGVGNRLTQVDGTGTSTYSYQAGSNRLAGIAGPAPTAFTYDANGNTLTENAKVYSYNQNQRLIQAAATQTGAYVYNAFGQRVKKTVAGVATYYIFDKNGQIIYETASDGTQAEYVYLHNQPLAKIDATGTNFIHTDHLGTPVMMTDATGAKVWEMEGRPFGDAATITGPGSLNMRFPGQYYDAETGNHYNYFRDYDPRTGRYLESDPIGLKGGMNTYLYSLNNPASYTDPLGLRCKSLKENFDANRRMTNDVIFGDHIKTAIGFATSGSVARTVGTVTPLQVLINAARTGSVSIANMTTLGTLASAGVNMLVNGALVAGSLEAGIVVGSGINALIQTNFQQDDCGCK